MSRFTVLITLRRVILWTTATGAAVALFLIATLPPRPSTAIDRAEDVEETRTVRGAYHVHSTVSDGIRDRSAIAEAAADAGLGFVIFTDHGDGTRQPEPPAYIAGVLCLDAVEISTDGGHYVAIDMHPSPYPLGGEPAAVVEDVRRLGGIGIVAHPYSVKEGLRWTDWSAAVDGIEWLNADSEWRDESRLRLLRTPFDYLFRPAPALAAMLDRPVETLARWDALATTRRVTGIAAHDAHGGLALGEEDGRRIGLPGIPSYRASFEAFSVRALLTEPLGGHAASDARLIVDALRGGKVYSAIDGIAAPVRLDFRARGDGGEAASMGDSLPFGAGIVLSARASMPSGARLVLICNGREVAESSSGRLESSAAAPGACRIEVRSSGAPGAPAVPWITSNPVYLLAAEPGPILEEPVVEIARSFAGATWRVESDAGSRASIASTDDALRIDYTLGAGGRSSQYVAAVSDVTPPLPEYDRVLFAAQAGAPSRLSVQVRTHGPEQRWRKSIYVDTVPRRISVPVAELIPVPGAGSLDRRSVTSLLFVVDLTNARPGTSGNLRISDVAFGVAR
ncbi:MAG TPA: hypothetical protein VLD67_03210 [Vicinamibacterales bacterium]|nr:hypothetical protein [Vicinamibacterales bacterium]